MTAVSLAGPPIPLATVQPAPAAPAADLAAAPAQAPAAAAAPAHLDVPAEFRTRLDAAIAEGEADGTQFGKEHSIAERWLVGQWALLRMKFPPSDDGPDLAYLHKLADSRTPDGIAAAQFWAKHGLTDEWEARLEDYTKHVGPAQARAATKLMHDALMMVNEATQTAKSAVLRKRPFAVDETLKLAVDKPGNNPSYPSGHTTAAYAACIVLAHLMPDRAKEFMDLAGEASFARLYAGVHFPTDVLAGAKLASTITSYLVQHSTVEPLRGTGSTNPGVAGGHKALPGATTLVGTPIGAGAVMGQGQPGA
jgi:hypothetical protein